jgi:hypothetical protein
MTDNFELLSFSSSHSIYPTLDFEDFSIPVNYEQTVKPQEVETTTLGIEVSEEKQTKQTYDVQDIPSIVYHPFDRVNDSLMRLSLMYEVEISQIKMANGILSGDDDLTFFEEEFIIIPGPKRLPLCVPAGKVKEEIEEEKRKLSVRFFQGIKHVNSDVAKCYLALSDYNLQKAVKEYEADIAWENEEKKKKEMMANASKKQSLFQFLACCYQKSQYILLKD